MRHGDLRRKSQLGVIEMLLEGRGTRIFRSRNAPPYVKRPLQGYARAKILEVRLPRDEMHARMFKATVYEIFRLGLFEHGASSSCVLLDPHEGKYGIMLRS